MLLPAAEEDTDPFVSQCADDDPVAFLGGLVHLVEGAGPEAVPDRFVGVLDKALVNKERPRVAAMDKGRLAAAFEYGCNPAEVKHRFGAFKKLATRTERGQKPGTVSCAAAREGGKERSIGMLGESAGDLAIITADGGVDRAQSQGERLHGDDGTLDQSGIISKRDCLGNKSQARSEEHTSELQSLTNLVCRLLLEKK